MTSFWNSIFSMLIKVTVIAFIIFSLSFLLVFYSYKRNNQKCLDTLAPRRVIDYTCQEYLDNEWINVFPSFDGAEYNKAGLEQSKNKED